MTTKSPSFSVEFGKVARTIEYRDDVGPVLFTFDLDAEQRVLVLDHHPLRFVRPSNYGDAFARSKSYLQTCGYRVEENGFATLPPPLTDGEVAALVLGEQVSPLPESVRLNRSPTSANFADDAGGMPWRLWVVAELETGPHAGHKVVFDEYSRQFGVASPIDKFLGFWGSFQQTIAALAAE